MSDVVVKRSPTEEVLVAPSKKKAGIKTSEFWMNLLVLAVPHFIEAMPPTWKVIANVATGAVYTIARTIAKR